MTDLMDSQGLALDLAHDEDTKKYELPSPQLTPVNEESPYDEHSPSHELRRVNGLVLPRSRQSVRIDDVQTPTPLAEADADAARNRSYSVPTTTADVFIDHGDSIAPRLSTPSQSSITSTSTARRDSLKLSARQTQELTSTPESIPTRRIDTSPAILRPLPTLHGIQELSETQPSGVRNDRGPLSAPLINGAPRSIHPLDGSAIIEDRPSSRKIAESTPLMRRSSNEQSSGSSRPRLPRAVSIPEPSSGMRSALGENHRALNYARHGHSSALEDSPAVFDSRPRSRKTTNHALPSPPLSPIPDTIPIPPLSIPTHLHLELSGSRPSPLYVHRISSSDTPYEPSRVKFERLMNFLLLPPQLERVLLFGALTCLDAWLYTFTILPLRFLKALWILLQWAGEGAWKEACYLANFVYDGMGRVWHRRKRRSSERPESPDSIASRRSSNAEVRSTMTNGEHRKVPGQLDGTTFGPQPPRGRRHHRRTKSVPSLLQATHKADLLHGLLIICSSVLLMRFDASRMYHGIRGQAAIKLYVIYNVLEVCDRLFSALGQDIIECLFSPETLERKANGRSKIITPFWMFLLALIYTVCHATAFFYQVITLNVAVNSYSNALLTLLMSNQFVEIKGTVFKKFEKENLFQLTCADVVERFQLWLMLLIIALRNIVELGGLSMGSSSSVFDTSSAPSSSGPQNPNVTTGATTSRAFSILPDSFMVLPSWEGKLQLLSPFLLVLGSEMLVDWLKHAYITKFNATSPRVYSRYLDVLAKDYYANAFGPQNLVRRLGLPVIPLACLFIRAVLQTYHMFLATNVSTPTPLTSATSLAVDAANATASPALAQIDHIFRNALGRSSFGGASPASDARWWSMWTLDDVIALTTMLVFFLAVYLLLLAFKLVLGMVLLGAARERYRGMKDREGEKVTETETRRVGPGGVVEVGEERRRVIYEHDVEGLRALRDKEAKAREKDERPTKSDRLDGVERYAMVAKRIW